ncbi:MAG: RnfH family protein [Proteobacteria bacterium]|nr:RnfH family protein [Pseudomonadota bacterium]
MKVELVYAGEHDQLILHLDLPVGATIHDGLAAASCLSDFQSLCVNNGLDVQAMAVGVFGVICEHDRVLSDGDRVELYRPLQMDPKEARRLRQPS